MFIHGKIMVDETAVGIPDLTVSLLQIKTPGDDVGVAETIRIGSVLTGPDGSFELSCEVEERPDLSLQVTAPENPATEACVEVLHTSCGVRQDAGCTESFAVRIPRRRLEDAGLRVPTSTPFTDAGAPAGWLSTIVEHTESTGTVRRGLHELVRKELDGEDAEDMARQAVLAPVVASMSKVSDSQRQSSSFVGIGDSVEQANRQVIREELLSKINSAAGRLPIEGVVALDADNLARFTDVSGQLRDDVAGQEMDEVIFLRRPEDRNTTDLVRQDPRAMAGRRAFLEEACSLFGEEGAGSAAAGASLERLAPASNDGENLQSFDAGITDLDDVPAAIAELLGTMTPPEQLDLDQRATDGDVANNISGLSLASGPADAPAFHDFYHLQIAFEPTWQEVLDQRAVDLVHESYREMVGMGGRIDRASGQGPVGLGDLRRAARQVRAYHGSEAPVVVLQMFDVEPTTWLALSFEQRSTLIRLAERLAEPQVQNGWPFGLWGSQSGRIREAARLRSMGERLIRYAELKARDGEVGYHRMHKLLEELDERLRTPYAFTIFAANAVERSINFGLLNTYRQYWQPITYQAGELVRTLTLAPKETRTFSHKTVINRSRSVKEAANQTSVANQEIAQTTRAETEIAARAETKTNFSLSAEGDFNLLLKNGKLTSTFGTDSARDSSDVKKNFREAVVKSTQEYREERKIEVDTEESMSFEGSISGEISNPNSELAVTYLFYELQRRYRISEQLHRVTPVVLVAQEMPAPHEIDEDWLVTHDWILKRVLLDESFRPALAAISERVAGDEFALRELRKHMLQQRDLVDALKEEMATLRSDVGRRYASLERALAHRADVVADDEHQSFIETTYEWLTDSSNDSEEAARLREDAARDAMDRAARQEADLRGRLQQQLSVLERVTSEYTSKVADHLNRKTQISRLQVHVKQNILYYMQAIWNHEPPDQRYFRLHKVQVPVLEGQRTYSLETADPSTPGQVVAAAQSYRMRCDLQIGDEWPMADLADVAHIDRLLGYKGNYMIFAMRESNDLTDAMMTPYIDTVLGVRDPDEIGNWTLEDFAEYVNALRQELSEEDFAALEADLRAEAERLLTAPRRASEEIVVPTDSLFIEALVGTHPILEKYKLQHRAVDVKKALAEVRSVELDNVRLAARLVAGEREDPDVDRKIVIEGSNAVVLPEA